VGFLLRSSIRLWPVDGGWWFEPVAALVLENLPALVVQHAVVRVAEQDAQPDVGGSPVADPFFEVVRFGG
jgi:hypothetical protein